MKKLSILIPTFNRHSKLIRLLNQIEEILINDNKLRDEVEILISDNCSPDITKEVVQSFVSEKKEFKYFRQKENLGFDGNVFFLYQNATSEFVWFFSDDDIILEGALQRIIFELNSQKLDIIIFSFIQPIGSIIKTFNFSEKLFISNDIETITESVFKYPKVSIYVIRKHTFNAFEFDVLKKYLGSGFYFISLAFSILEKSNNPTIGIISEPLASCDEDYEKFEANPDVFLYYYNTLKHPFVEKLGLNYYRSKMKISYLNAIHYVFKVRTGHFSVSDLNFFIEYGKKMDAKFEYLFLEPRIFLKFLIIKFNYIKLLNLFNK